MPLISCPECGESSDLAGDTRPDGTIALTCGACGAAWVRDPTPRCVACGSTNLEYAPKPLWERGRGEQRTPAGRYDAYICNACGRADATRQS